ncbi:MAG TPA: peptidylprolyl isomerase [Planctomycetota bacterium]|nr:peptidylprolyl isomerase [Planctomycetota bacterium]
MPYSNLGRAFIISSCFLAACSSTPPEKNEPRKPDNDEEVRKARLETEEAVRNRKEAEAKLEDTVRELERARKELAASRDTTSATATEARLSQDLLMSQRKAYEQKIAFYKNLLAQQGTRQVVGGAAPQAPAAAPDDAAVSSAAPAQPEKKGGIDLDVPVAFVDGDAITRREFAEWLLVSEAGERLDKFIDFYLVRREAKRQAIDSNEQEEESFVLTNLAKVTAQAGGEKELDKKLAQAGTSRDALLDSLRFNARSCVLVTKLCLLERNTKEGKARREELARQAYEKQFGEHVEASMLFLKVAPDTPEDEVKQALELARKEREQLVVGEDWKKVAAQSKAYPAQTDRGIYSHAELAQFPELERAIFTGTPGEVGEPVRWKFGISIVRVERKIPAQSKFEDVKVAILADIEKPEPTKEEQEALYSRLRKTAKIEKRIDPK